MTEVGILEYCMTLSPEEASENPGCICAFAISEGKQKQDEHDEYVAEYKKQISKLANEVINWKVSVSDFVSKLVSTNRKVIVYEEGNHLIVNNHTELCDSFRNSTYKCTGYRKKAPKEEECGYNVKKGEELLNPFKYTRFHLPCYTDEDAIWDAAKYEFGETDFRGFSQTDPFDSSWRYVHPILREIYMGAVGGVKKYPLLSIVEAESPRFNALDKQKGLDIRYTISGMDGLEIPNISCCTNSIKCANGCDENTFRNILQSCSQEYSTEIDQDQNVDIETVVEIKDEENQVEVFVSENLNLLIGFGILVVVLVILLTLGIVYYYGGFNSASRTPGRGVTPATPGLVKRGATPSRSVTPRPYGGVTPRLADPSFKRAPVMFA